MHDSEHSYECMWFEFNEAFSSMVKGGILMSDDIYFNNSFYDFAKKQNKNIIKGGAGIGIIIK